MWAYKEKSKGGKGNLALLGYPVLMAADIMLYSPCLGTGRFGSEATPRVLFQVSVKD